MIGRIEAAVLENRERIAYVHNDERITYGELWEKVCRYAGLLKRQGSGPVVVYGHKSIDMIISLFSCIKANRAYVPVDTYMPLSRIESIIESTAPDLIIANERIEIEGVDTCTLYDLERYSDDEIKNSNSCVVYMIFTSGSTGNAKGVPISYSNLDNFIGWISDIEPLKSYKNTSVLNQASFSFDLSVADIYYSICNGHTLVAADRELQKDYAGFFEYIAKNKIELFVSTPTFMKLCLVNKEFNFENYPFVKCMFFCGEQLEKSTVEKIYERFPDIKIINAYGPTEATCAVSASLITKEDVYSNHPLLPVGTVDSNATELFIEDNEIVLSGKSVFGGYLGGIIGGHYTKNGVNFYRTGDIGYIENGRIYCKGRKDSQIKFKGYRIELNDIESNIKKIKGVVDAAVVAKFNKNGIVKAIDAFAVCEEEITGEYIKNELKLMLPHYMIPRQIKLMDSLPTNDNKKTDRKKLAQL